jgi:hypothetical protein
MTLHRFRLSLLPHRPLGLPVGKRRRLPGNAPELARWTTAGCRRYRTPAVAACAPRLPQGTAQSLSLPCASTPPRAVPARSGSFPRRERRPAARPASARRAGSQAVDSSALWPRIAPRANGSAPTGKSRSPPDGIPRSSHGRAAVLHLDKGPESQYQYE